MPTYEYHCPDCQRNFEEFQSITAKPIQKCPHCRGNKVKRLIGSGSALIFKGNGFYQTDYRSDSYNKAAKSEKESSSSSSEKSGESKSETKSGSKDL